MPVLYYMLIVPEADLGFTLDVDFGTTIQRANTAVFLRTGARA